TFELASYQVCLAQARLAWARGNAAETLSWLEQAVDRGEFAAEAGQAAYETNGINIEQLIYLCELGPRAPLHGLAVRHSCEAIGYDLSDVDQQPQLGSLDNVAASEDKDRPSSFLKRNFTTAVGAPRSPSASMDLPSGDPAILSSTLARLQN